MKRVATILCLLLSCAVSAQDRLTLQEAVAKALEHNFDIRMSKTVADQAAVNNTLGNAGMLPNVFGTATFGATSANTKVQLVSGDEQNRDGARSSNLNTGINLNWTLFDGFRMFISKRRLDELERFGELSLKAQVQSTVSDVIKAYSLIVYQQQQVVAIDTGLSLAKVRMDLSLAKYETGLSPKTDFLQARVDYNARRSDSLNQLTVLNNSFGTLNLLMGEDALKIWQVDDTLISDLTLEQPDKEKLAALNFGLQSFQSNAAASRLQADIAKGAMLPTLTGNAGYAFSQSRSETGFAFLNQNLGLTGSLTLNVPVFMGGNLRRQAKVATLQALSDQLQYDKQATDFGRKYRSAWATYRVALASFQLETENIKYAKENLDIQKARFRVGVGNTLETRQAENDYVTALVRFYNSIYNLKTAETDVLILSNGLVK